MCTRIAQAYIAEGGLRDSLPKATDDKVVSELDAIFLEIGSADQDLFKAMVAAGDGLANKVIRAGEPVASRSESRLRRCASKAPSDNLRLLSAISTRVQRNSTGLRANWAWSRRDGVSLVSTFTN